MTNTKVRLQRSTDARLLARAARLFMAWGNRELADYAHIQRIRAMAERRMAQL
jgi:hypothetical protein